MLWSVNPLPGGGGCVYRVQVWDSLQTGRAKQVSRDICVTLVWQPLDRDTDTALQEAHQTAESRQLRHGVQHQLPGPGGQEQGQAGHLVHHQEPHRDDGEAEGQPGVPHLGVPGQPGQLGEPQLECEQKPGQQRRQQPQRGRRGEEHRQHVWGEGDRDQWSVSGCAHVVRAELRNNKNGLFVICGSWPIMPWIGDFVGNL